MIAEMKNLLMASALNEKTIASMILSLLMAFALSSIKSKFFMC